MKRLSTLLCTLLLLLTLAPTAHADVLWTPNNSFFEDNYEDCTYVGRSYYANGAEGYVTLWNAPGGSLSTAQYENGFTLHVYWQYEDWGCVTVWGDEGNVDGWVPMSDLTLIYDHISFGEEYAARITGYNDEFSGYTGEADHINFYEYPGAPEISYTADLTALLEMLEMLTMSGGSAISSVFVDEEGRTWGYVEYLYGIRNVWFCLDEPDGTDFPVREVSTEELTPAAQPALPSSAYLPWLLVGGVVAVTAVLLVFLWLRKKRKTMT